MKQTTNIYFLVDCSCAFNNVNSHFAIAFLSVSMRGNANTVTLSNSKALNGFSQTIFVSRATLHIKNCTLKDCGGPLLFLASDVLKVGETPESKGLPTVVIDEKTVMENWVTGSEAWFKINNAEMLSSALTTTGEDSLASYLDAYGRTILGKQGELYCFNFIAITLDPYHFGDSEAGKYYSYSKLTIQNSSDPAKDIHLDHNPGDEKFKVAAQDNGKQGMASLITTAAGGYIGFTEDVCKYFGLDYSSNFEKCRNGSYLNIETDLGTLMYGHGPATGNGGTLNLVTGYYAA